MNKSFTHYANIGKFISNINGNWRNSVYITCSICRFEKQNCCEDILASFDGDGIPTLITVNDANYIFATVVDKTECLAEISNAKFSCLFDLFLRKNTVDEKGCPFLQLSKNSNLPDEHF